MTALAAAQAKNLRAMTHEARARISAVGTEVPALEATLLLGKAIGQSGEFILAHPEYIPTPAQAGLFEELVRRRERREPVAYILGEKEFYSLLFKVDRRALAPRPETETLVDTVLEMFPAGSRISALEIGVGTGIISVCLAKSRPEWRITATDISGQALSLARENVETHLGAGGITLIEADLFPPGAEKFDLIVSNPPYIPAGGVGLSPDITWHEPALALYGGEDGLDVIRRIVERAPGRLNTGGGIVMEIGHDQMEQVAELLSRSGFFKTIRAVKDLFGVDRVMVARG